MVAATLELYKVAYKSIQTFLRTKDIDYKWTEVEACMVMLMVDFAILNLTALNFCGEGQTYISRTRCEVDALYVCLTAWFAEKCKQTHAPFTAAYHSLRNHPIVWFAPCLMRKMKFKCQSKPHQSVYSAFIRSPVKFKVDQKWHINCEKCAQLPVGWWKVLWIV